MINRNKVDILVLLDEGFESVYYASDYSSAYIKITDSMTLTISKPELIDTMMQQLKAIKETLLLRRKMNQDSLLRAAQQEKIAELKILSVPKVQEIVKDLPEIKLAKPELKEEEEF